MYVYGLNGTKDSQFSMYPGQGFEPEKKSNRFVPSRNGIYNVSVLSSTNKLTFPNRLERKNNVPGTVNFVPVSYFSPSSNQPVLGII